MDGVFINLTKDEAVITSGESVLRVGPNVDLVTPVREEIRTSVTVSGTVSVPLDDCDIHYLQATSWFNTSYNKVLRSEKSVCVESVIVSPYIKYPFTQDQIDKINLISNNRTRLFILSKNEAIVWSQGGFDCPFRNYRLFSVCDGLLHEYPIPKTYLDVVVASMKKMVH